MCICLSLFHQRTTVSLVCGICSTHLPQLVTHTHQNVRSTQYLRSYIIPLHHHLIIKFGLSSGWCVARFHVGLACQQHVPRYALTLPTHHPPPLSLPFPSIRSLTHKKHKKKLGETERENSTYQHHHSLSITITHCFFTLEKIKIKSIR